MPTSTPTLKDIYAGKPDASDEFKSNGDNAKFISSFITPDDLTPESFFENDKCFVTGYKGTGKTAILLFWRDQVISDDHPGVASIVCFKQDIDPIERLQMEGLCKKLIAYVDASDAPLDSKVDYEHLWKLFFFKKIVDDNSCLNGKTLFVNDDNWRRFEEIVSNINLPKSGKSKYSLKSISLKTGVEGNGGFFGEGAVDLSKDVSDNTNWLADFKIMIDEAVDAFEAVQPTDIPYYLFIDELEAYHGDEKIFTRDLQLIRDLLFTVKKFHLLHKMHLICAVRTEVLNAIDRFMPAKELNKAIEGFDEPLRWTYSNTNSISHPILKILLKRISMAYSSESNTRKLDAQLFAEWFPTYIGSRKTESYILDYGWNKPRDIVRLITAAQADKQHNTDSRFSQAVFDSSMQTYSRSSLREIKEELNALYSPQDRDDILRLFRGGKEVLAYTEIVQKAHSDEFADTVWKNKLSQILDDLFRVGFLGNRSKQRFRGQHHWVWLHKGEEVLLTNDAWDICIHKALLRALAITPSLSSRSLGYSVSTNDSVPDNKNFPVDSPTDGSTSSSVDNNTLAGSLPQNSGPAQFSSLSQFEDKELSCRECGANFYFTAGEQEFWAEKGFENEPSRCQSCRRERKYGRRQGTSERWEATCASCGGLAVVPFNPVNGRPVYCSACFSNSR